MDYRQLLKKYVSYVGCCEGTTFIPEDMNDNFGYAANPFLKDELSELIKIDQETRQEEMQEIKRSAK